MGLRINTNIAAMNAHRQLSATDSRLSKSMEKLSSGYRINHAADDAAGMAIANRLRTDIRSLSVASRNVTEARSMVNIAEGAGLEVQGILERMKELATQAASDNAANDRDKIQAEYTALKNEIDRIVNDTEYQGSQLIDGSFGATAVFSDTTIVTADEITLNGAAAGTYTMAAAGTTASLTDGSITQIISFTAGESLNFSALGIEIETDGAEVVGDFNAETITVAGSGGTFQVGSSGVTGTDEDQISVSLGDLTAATLGVDALDMTSTANAQSALDTLDLAINSVADVLGDIGATVNRLDYAYSNLQSTIENESASQSVIRDVDMAAEMVDFTKNQILTQAGTAMLAQANMAPQQILSLFG